MNMQQPDPVGLFDQYKSTAQTPPANKSVTAQLGNRPMVSADLPAVNVLSVQQSAVPASNVANNPFVELYQSGEMARAVEQYEQKKAANNGFKALYDSGQMSYAVLKYEDQQYTQQLTDWERRKKEFIPYPGMGINAHPDAPQPPMRNPEQIADDWQKGIHHLRGNELGSILNQLETGRLSPEQEAQITQYIEPQLTPEIRNQLQTARLTRDELQKLNAAALAEEEQAKQFAKENLFMNPFQIVSDERFGQHTQSSTVFGRGVAKGLTMNYAFAPDEKRLNSDDPTIVADERAKRLFYQQQNAQYPVSASTGNILGAAPHLVVGGAALRGARVAKANLGLMAPTELTAKAIAANRAVLASKGAATTTGGRVAMGAGGGLVYDLASRPEGSEDMDLAENLQARVEQAGVGVALGSMMELGLLKAGQAWRWGQDRRFQRQLLKEADAAGYGTDTNAYLMDMLNIRQTEDGRLVAGLNRQSVTDLPELEPGHVPPGSSPGTDTEHSLSRAEQDRLDETQFPSLQSESEPGSLPVPDATPGTTATGDTIPTGAERFGSGETEAVVSGGEQPTVSPEITAGTGKTTERVSTIKGTKFNVEFELVDADDLSTSHLGNGVVNPDYPEALQPRDRTKMTSEAQIREIANTLDPEWLGSSPKASDGAPIIGDDGLVESGNGRILALRLAYAQGDQGRSGLYRQWLKDNAEKFGVDPTAVDGMNKPVLVRKRTTPMSDEERIRYTKEANDPDEARYSPTEQAKIDASRLTDDDIIMFAPGENGNIAAESNLNFLHRFVKSVGLADTAGLFDKNNRPNQVLVQRVQSAIFKKAYDDDRLLSLMAETTDVDMKGEAARNMVAALTKAAPTFARARAMGNIPLESDFIPNLLEAVELVRQSRRENQSLSEIISQGSLLESVDPITEELATFLDVNLRSSQRMGEVLKDLGQQLENEVARGGDDLFGSAPANKADFLSSTNRTMEARGERAPFTREQSEAGSEAAKISGPVEAGRTEGQPTEAGRTEAENAKLDKVVSREIEVTTPDGTETIHVEKKPDGSITADGQPIPMGGVYVPNTHKNRSSELAGSAGTLYSNPINFAIRQMAQSLNLGETAFSAFGGGVYGATYSDEDIGSTKWWLDVMGGASLASFGMAALRYNKVIGKDSFLANFSKYLGQQWEKIPGLGRGSPEIRRLKKQQQLMRQIINRQTGQMGEFLVKNFTPSERSEMADIIENRGYPKQANLVARQAQELDDFISYTAERMKDLGMLSPDMETGGYLHRYYAKHLKVGMGEGIEGIFKQAKKTLSGSYTIARGTNETFQPEYLSDAVKQQMAEYDRINNRINELERTKDDLLFVQTSDELNDLKEELKALQDIQLKEYVGIQNDKPHSFIFMPDEVPVVPGLQPFAGSNTPPVQPEEAERIWSLRGTVGEQPVLWRDWTKTEREKWGEITDAGYRFVRGQAEVAHDLSMATMFHKISQRSDWVSDKPITLNDEEWVEVSRGKIPKSQMYKYGALAGKYVKPDVWRAIRHYNQPLFGRGRAATIYRNMLDKWKVWKTVYNPVSHFNNTVSNLQMYYMAGYSARHLGSSINELRRGENSQYWREARDVGLFGSDWSSSLLEGGEQSSNLAELAEVLRNQPDIADANQVNDSLSMINRLKTWLIESKESVNSADTKLGSGAAAAKAIASPVVGLMNKPIKAATDSAKWLYQKEDELFKLAVFIEERKKGMKPFDAMEAANRFFFDYNDLPDIVRKVKDFPIGSPFISYTYLALPAIVKNAIERPERMLALAAAFEGLNYASLTLDGQLEEQGYWDRMDAENTMNPSWMKGRAMWGAPNTIDVSGFKPGLDSYKISMANAHAMGNPFAGESGKDLPLWPSFMGFWGPDPIGGNPVTRIPFDILFNQDWKGDPMYGENDKYEKSLKYAYQAIFPSMPLFPGSWHQKKIIEGMAGDSNKAREEGQPVNQLAEGIVTAANSVSEALGGEQFTGADWRGKQFKTTDALAGSVGLKLRHYQPKDLYLMQHNKIKKKIADEQMEYKRKVRGNYTKAQKEQFKVDYRERMAGYQDDQKKLKSAYNSIK